MSHGWTGSCAKLTSSIIASLGTELSESKTFPFLCVTALSTGRNYPRLDPHSWPPAGASEDWYQRPRRGGKPSLEHCSRSSGGLVRGITARPTWRLAARISAGHQITGSRPSSRRPARLHQRSAGARDRAPSHRELPIDTNNAGSVYRGRSTRHADRGAIFR